MDVRIGVLHTMKEIEVELPSDADRDAVRTKVEDALASETGVLWLTDRTGKDVAIPSSKIAYVELTGQDSERRVGFGAA